MKGWLIKAWHDPVWSKVISGLILGVLATVWLWAKSGFNTNLAIAWAASNAALRALWDWLSRPLGMSRGLTLLIVVLISVGIIELVRRLLVVHAARLGAMRLHQESLSNQLVIETRSHGIDVTRLTDERNTIEEKLRDITEKFTQADRARSNLPDERAESQAGKKPASATSHLSDQTVEALKNALAKTLPAADDLQDSEVRFLRSLYRAYDQAVGLRATASPMSYPRAERMAEKLEKDGLVRIIPATQWNETSVVLTKTGRNYCDDNNLR